MQEQIDKDLKQALLSGDKVKTEVLRSLKNALQYEAVRLKLAIAELSQAQMTQVLSKEAKKRQEAAELYKKGGEASRAEAELAEKAIIDSYLPEQLSEGEIAQVVDAEIAKLDQPSLKDMGIVIHGVKQKLQAQADGAVIARLVRQKLETR